MGLYFVPSVLVLLIRLVRQVIRYLDTVPSDVSTSINREQVLEAFFIENVVINFFLNLSCSQQLHVVEDIVIKMLKFITFYTNLTPLFFIVNRTRMLDGFCFVV